MSQLLVERACARLRSAIGDEAVVRLKFNSDLQEMLDLLEVIQPAALEEAEMQLTDHDDNKKWLNDVRNTAYAVMDMVDEWQDTTAPAVASVCAVTRCLFFQTN
jgi:hypothetical protein